MPTLSELFRRLMDRFRIIDIDVDDLEWFPTRQLVDRRNRLLRTKVSFGDNLETNKKAELRQQIDKLTTEINSREHWTLYQAVRELVDSTNELRHYGTVQSDSQGHISAAWHIETWRRNLLPSACSIGHCNGNIYLVPKNGDHLAQVVRESLDSLGAAQSPYVESYRVYPVDEGRAVCIEVTRPSDVPDNHR